MAAACDSACFVLLFKAQARVAHGVLGVRAIGEGPFKRDRAARSLSKLSLDKPTDCFPGARNHASAHTHRQLRESVLQASARQLLAHLPLAVARSCSPTCPWCRIKLKERRSEGSERG